MQEASDMGAHESGYMAERAMDQATHLPGVGVQGGAAGLAPDHDRAAAAFVAVALARLERDHVALLAALCELEGDAPAIGRGAQVAAGAVIPAVERAALSVLLREDLRQTQRALGLAADGRYGRCQGCGAPITSAVLLLQPATVECALCAAAAHKRVVH